MLKALVWDPRPATPADTPSGAADTANGHGSAALGTHGSFRELLGVDQCRIALAAPDSLLWLDLTAPSQEELQRVAEEFGLHPLAVEDAAKHNQRPKIDEYDGFYFLVIFCVQQRLDQQPAAEEEAGARRLDVGEIDLFISKRFLITVHDAPLPLLEQLRERWRHNSRAIDQGIGVLLYTVLDGIVDAYFPVLDDIIERVEQIEENIFTDVGKAAKNDQMRSLFQVKRDLLELRRVIAPERDALLVLARQEISLFDRSVAVYFQDVYDHVVRVTDAIDVYQDLLTNALESYLSLVSNNLNQVMKTLTSITVILMVPTLIAGVYGMNFENMPELHWSFGYGYALGLMALSAFLLFLFFRRRGWI